MVNRELTRRVKFGQEVAWASRAVHSDVHTTLSLVKALDKKTGLWEYALSDMKVLHTHIWMYHYNNVYIHVTGIHNSYM